MQVIAARIARFCALPWCTLAVFLTLGIVPYISTLFGEFVYDDALFYQHRGIRSWAYLFEVWFNPSLDRIIDNAHYRPLTFASFALNFLLTGESPFWFHAVNIFLNGCAAWLLFRVTERLFGNRTLAWITAIFFVFLPIHTESVAYIKARDEILVACFGFAAWFAFLRATETPLSLRWSLAAAALSFCAFFSKESALVFPGVFVCSLLLLHGWRATVRAWKTIALQVIAIGAFLLLRWYAVGGTFVSGGEILYFGQNPLGYVAYEFVPWTAFQLFFIAVAKTFVPWNLSATYGFAHIPIIDSPLDSWMAMAGIMTLALMLGVFCRAHLRRSPIGVGILTFLILYFPFSKIPFHTSIDFFAERWLFAPSAGLAMVGGYAFWLLWRRWRHFASVLFAAVVLSCLFVLVPRSLVWLDDTRLGESMVASAPDSVISYVFLANNRMQYGRLQEATELVTRGLSISREHIPIHHIAAALAMGAGELVVAEQAVRAAEARGGDELANIILRATLLAKQHRYEESLASLQASRWFDPMEFRTRMLLALNLWMLGRQEEALQYFDWDQHLPVKHMTNEEKFFMFETY